MGGDAGALASALAYARHGWPVFPCKPGAKEPDTPHGFKDATTSLARVRAWWQAVPGRNVAIATGAPGPDVLDVDVRPDGDGYAGYDQLRRAGLLDGALAIVATPGGGLHAYYAGTRQRCGRLPARHLDFKAVGGYVLAPPSQVGGRRYEVTGHQRQASVAGSCLDWAAVVSLLDPPRRAPWPGQPRARGFQAIGGSGHLGSGVSPCDRVPGQQSAPLGQHRGSPDVVRLAGWVAGLEVGNRNAGLFWAACRLAEAGQDDAFGDLARAARTTGLPETEIWRTIGSAQRTAAREHEHSRETWAAR